MASRRALITGIAGQDGSYLAELLLREGYVVCGMVRSASQGNYERIEHIKDQLELVQGDMLDQSSLEGVLRDTNPNEVYNLAAQSFVPTSWHQPTLTAEFTALGVIRLLEAIRAVNPDIKLYQASSSEMFGHATIVPQNEETPFNPRSPYGVAKVYGHHIASNYRERYGVFAVSGILFNHESPRRGLEFVTRKVTDGVAQIKVGKKTELLMGNLDAQRDWGFAGDYVRSMWLMMQQPSASDFVIASGKTHTIKQLLEFAFDQAGLDWEKYVKIDQRFVRPPESHILCGDPSKAMRQLGWKPEVSFEQLIRMMVNADLERHHS